MFFVIHGSLLQHLSKTAIVRNRHEIRTQKGELQLATAKQLSRTVREVH